MKKVVALFISVFVLLTCFMCGCKKNDGSNGNGYDKGREEETEEAETKETAGTENSGNAEGNVPDGSGVEDPTQETSVTMGPSGHIFENGKCTDCDMLWTEYVYDAIGEMTGDTGDGYHTYILEDCDLFLSSGDTVKYNLANKEHIFIYYVHTCDENSMITLSITDSNEVLHKDTTYIVLNIAYRFSRFNSEEDAVPLYRFNYIMTIFVEPEDDIFSSKEHFKKVCNLETEKVLYEDPRLIIHNEEDYPHGTRAWDAMTEDEIKELFDEYGVTYLSKDEFIDLVWEDHDNYFGSIDSGLEKINTSLADDGFNWK